MRDEGTLRIASWEYYSINPIKLTLLGACLGAVGGVSVFVLTESLLGVGAFELAAIIAIVVSYLTMSFPKRIFDSASLSQSREAPVLAVMGSASAEATRSRTRTMLSMTPSDSAIAELLRVMRHEILLGFDPASALERVEGRIASYSLKNVLSQLASGPTNVPEGGEEARGITQSAQLAEESKLPLFIAVAFFAPIMLLLLIIFTHIDSPASLAEVVGLEFVLLDLGLYFSSSEKQKLA